MTWDEISTILQIIGGILVGISFLVGTAIIWTGIKANAEKDAKAKEQAERIAELDLKRVEAERELASIQERLRARSLSEEQAKGIVQFLSKLPPATITVEIIGNDFEASVFGRQLIEVLNKAGWKVNIANVFGSAVVGFGIVVTDGQNKDAINLQQAFNSVGLEHEAAIDPKGTSDPLVLVIGAKPDKIEISN